MGLARQMDLPHRGTLAMCKVALVFLASFLIAYPYPSQAQAPVPPQGGLPTATCTIERNRVNTRLFFPKVPYALCYAIEDGTTGVIYDHHESFDGNVVSGSYGTDLPDGRKQVVSYQYDKFNRYMANVTYLFQGQSYTQTFFNPYPSTGQGFNPSAGLGFNPSAGQGFNPSAGQGFNPAAVQGFRPGRPNRPLHHNRPFFNNFNNFNNFVG